MPRPLPRHIDMIDDVTAAILRKKTPDERVAMAFECNRIGRAMLRTQIEEKHPDWTTEQVDKEVARRMAGDPR